MKQEWMPICIFNGEFVANSKGEIKNAATGTVLKQRMDKRQGKGYLRVNIVFDGKHKTYSCHRLVLMAFKGIDLSKPQVNHKDGNKINNHIDNLEWCTGSENIQHAVKTGLKKTPIYEHIKGVGHPSNKTVLFNGKTYESVELLSQELNLSAKNIARVCRGERKTYKGLNFKYVHHETAQNF